MALNMKDQKVLVFGAGLSGIAAAKLLLQIEAEQVILYDGNGGLDEAELFRKTTESLPEEVPVSGRLKIVLGDLPEQLLETLNLVILSPGVPTDLPLVEDMRRKNIRIWGEVELAYSCGKGDVLAITGTNGKTTTTTLLGEIMQAYLASSGRHVYVVGNIGVPYTDIALNLNETDLTVAEISSFQLETTEHFAPKVSAILNITPDHMNRHHTMDAYIKIKESITRNQGPEDTCVLNYEDETLRAFAETLRTKVFFFSSARKLSEGIYLDGGKIWINDGKRETVLVGTEELQVLGRHNYENVMAAAAMALSYGVPVSVIRETVRSFHAVEHRIEYVAEKSGVAYYNDSKATNPDAAIKGIEAMERPTLLIGGGYDKHSSYEEWIRAFNGKVKALVLFGETKNEIAKSAKACGFEPVILKDTLEEAVAYCAAHAKSGDAVLLSPACASWDMFSNYEERGRKFKELVMQLKD